MDYVDDAVIMVEWRKVLMIRPRVDVSVIGQLVEVSDKSARETTLNVLNIGFAHTHERRNSKGAE